MRRGAIILCGGKSSRMGRDKATLPFGPEQMLQRVVRLIGEAVDPQNVVVVAAPGQALPPLPDGVTVARDSHESRGPLEGLATGFRALGDRVDAVYASGCDVPLLAPAFVDQMFNSLGDHDIVVPCEDQYYHPLAAVYRPCVLAKIEGLLAAEQLRPRFLFDVVRTRQIQVADLREVDPQLSSLKNLNSPEDYSDALATAGYGM
jgi:molybdopterin-guanine dinucleotide biosynthesis protein A